MAKPPPLRHTYYFAASPARVFAALTDPALLTKWFVEKAVVTPRPGGAYRLSWGAGFSMKGKIEEFSAPKRMTVTWVDRLEGGKTFETQARFSLTKKGKGTLLEVTHRGFKSGKKWLALHGAVQSGWAYYLMNLKSVLDHGIDLRSPSDALG
jgi:uncharacterized protein YndB with AHSA1/START domain